MTFGSLFAGIGGIDLGLKRAGFECRWQVENDPFCQKILSRHWPEVKRYGDIRTVRGSELKPVDLICGGFPCQDLSQAGKRAGIEGTRSGLWFEFARLVGELRPRWVLIENVAGLLVYDGMRRVIGELARLGYVGIWRSLRAADFGASHLRKRVFIVAYRDGAGSGEFRRGGVFDGQREACGNNFDGCDKELAHRAEFGRSEGRAESARSQRRFDVAERNGELGYTERPRRPQARFGRYFDAGAEPETGGGVLDDAGSSERRPHDERRRRAGEGVDAEGKAAGGSGEPSPGDVSDSPSPRLEERRCIRGDDREERAAAERDCGTLRLDELAHADDREPDQQQSEESQADSWCTTRRAELRAGGCNFGIPAFAPGPADPRWPDILRERPDLAPALESPLRRVADGLPGDLDGAMQDRTKRLGRLGNAVVPQIAEWIGLRIIQAERGGL